VLPEILTKTGTERVVVLNKIAKRVIDSRWGIDEEFVFTYRGGPVSRLHSCAWKRAWKKAKLPAGPGILKGVRNLRHTFSRRLRSAGVSLETCKVLLGHTHGDITTHYSDADELPTTWFEASYSSWLTALRRHARLIPNLQRKP
jgi:integrase